MSTHTPGPWKAEDWGGIHTKIRAGEDDTFVATVTGGLAGQSGPNARLIAAAPLMLAELHNAANLIRAYDKGDPTDKTGWDNYELMHAWLAIRAAIAKAEGTS